MKISKILMEGDGLVLGASELIKEPYLLPFIEPNLGRVDITPISHVLILKKKKTFPKMLHKAMTSSDNPMIS